MEGATAARGYVILASPRGHVPSAVHDAGRSDTVRVKNALFEPALSAEAGSARVQALGDWCRGTWARRGRRSGTGLCSALTQD